jgi:hypothetical protein
VKGGKGFLYSVGENNFDFGNLCLFENNGTGTENENDSAIKNFLPVYKNKTLCWICYKVIIEETSFLFESSSMSFYKSKNTTSNNKSFCSKLCLDKYTNESLVI